MQFTWESTNLRWQELQCYCAIPFKHHPLDSIAITLGSVFYCGPGWLNVLTRWSESQFDNSVCCERCQLHSHDQKSQQLPPILACFLRYQLRQGFQLRYPFYFFLFPKDTMQEKKFTFCLTLFFETLGIDIDCNGVVNGITTTQSRLSLFKLPLCNSSTERCNYVALSTSNLSISSNLTNSACNSSATVNSGGSIITSSVSLLVRGTETCSTLDSLCAGSYSFNTSIVFAQSLSPGPGVNCTSPLGISLISPSSAQARHDFLCRYPLPVDCVVSDWSEWSVVTPCGVPTCEIVSTRNRTIQTNSSHGGLSCPPLADSKSVDCTSNDCDYPDTVCTAATPCSMETCSTSMDCTRTSIVPSTCTNGAVTSCEPVTTTQTTPCTKCFYTEWASWTNVGACEGGLQTQNRIRELVKACPSTNTCTDVLETQEIPCVQPRDCTFGINPNCENSINCGFGIYCCGSCQTPPSPSPSPSPSPCCIPDPDPDCPHLNLCSTGPCCGRCRC